MMSTTNVDIFKEFLTSQMSLKEFAVSKQMGYAAMRNLILRTQHLFDGKSVSVHEFFPEHVKAYRAKYEWARRPDYVHDPPSAIWNRKQWLLFVQAHEHLLEQSGSLANDQRKVSDLTVAELVLIIKSCLYSGSN